MNLVDFILKFKKMPLKSTIKAFFAGSLGSQLPEISTAESLDPSELLQQDPEQLITSVVMGFVGILLNRLLDYFKERRAAKKAPMKKSK